MGTTLRLLGITVAKTGGSWLVISSARVFESVSPGSKTYLGQEMLKTYSMSAAGGDWSMEGFIPRTNQKKLGLSGPEVC